MMMAIMTHSTAVLYLQENIPSYILTGSSSLISHLLAFIWSPHEEPVSLMTFFLNTGRFLSNLLIYIYKLNLFFFCCWSSVNEAIQQYFVPVFQDPMKSEKQHCLKYNSELLKFQLSVISAAIKIISVQFTLWKCLKGMPKEILNWNVHVLGFIRHSVKLSKDLTVFLFFK